MSDDRRLAGWEIASWTLACLIALVLVSAVVQRRLELADQSRTWKPVPVQQSDCSVVWHRGCVAPVR